MFGGRDESTARPRIKKQAPARNRGRNPRLRLRGNLTPEHHVTRVRDQLEPTSVLAIRISRQYATNVSSPFRNALSTAIRHCRKSEPRRNAPNRDRHGYGESLRESNFPVWPIV